MAIAADAVDHADAAAVQVDRERVQRFGIKIHRGISCRVRALPRPPHKAVSPLTPAPSARGSGTARQVRVSAARAEGPDRGRGPYRAACRSAARSRQTQWPRYAAAAGPQRPRAPAGPTLAWLAPPLCRRVGRREGP